MSIRRKGNVSCILIIENAYYAKVRKDMDSSIINSCKGTLETLFKQLFEILLDREVILVLMQILVSNIRSYNNKEGNQKITLIKDTSANLVP